MVIASLYLGSQSSPPVEASPVPVTQQQLRSLENYESAHLGADGPGQWSTFPTELVALLNTSPELQSINRANWKIVTHLASNHPDLARDKILKDIATSVAALGMPAILSLKTNDHWVLVSTVWVDDANGSVDSIQFADPAGWPSTATGAGHTYRDNCEMGGSQYWVVTTSADLASLDLKIGTASPTTYKDKCLAVVYKEPGQQPSLVKALKKKEKPRKTPPPPPVFLTVGASPQQAAVFADLQQIAHRLDLDELRPLLTAGARVRVWRVKDIDGSAQEYALALVDSPNSRRVVIAVCDPVTYAVSRFQLPTKNSGLDSLINVPEKETLWWTRKLEDTYWQPFFPFRREDLATGPRYKRLIDGLYLS
jgi:hypothetical protein